LLPAPQWSHQGVFLLNAVLMVCAQAPASHSKGGWETLTCSFMINRQGVHLCWSQWSYQGVFLLNAVLTVRAHTPASHSKRGWETFTDAAISTLSARRRGLVFLLWGRCALSPRVFCSAWGAW
jgi:uracil DNA glycosylase